MLNKRDDEERDAVGRMISKADFLKDAFYPLTLPLTVGPGSISVAITLGANAPYRLRENLFAVVAAAIASFLIAVSVYLCYGFSDRLELMIGPNGMNVIVRLTSFLVVCIGVQILWNGISTLLLSLPNKGF